MVEPITWPQLSPAVLCQAIAKADRQLRTSPAFTLLRQALLAHMSALADLVELHEQGSRDPVALGAAHQVHVAVADEHAAAVREFYTPFIQLTENYGRAIEAGDIDAEAPAGTGTSQGAFADLPDSEKRMLNLAYGHALMTMHLMGSAEERRLAEARNKLNQSLRLLADLAEGKLPHDPPDELLEQLGRCVTGLPDLLNDHGDAVEAYREAMVAETQALNAMFPGDEDEQLPEAAGDPAEHADDGKEHGAGR